MSCRVGRDHEHHFGSYQWIGGHGGSKFGQEAKNECVSHRQVLLILMVIVIVMVNVILFVIVITIVVLQTT